MPIVLNKVLDPREQIWTHPRKTLNLYRSLKGGH